LRTCSAAGNNPYSPYKPKGRGHNSAIIKAGKLLDIETLDHLIIGGNSFVSLNRRCLGFGEGKEE
jgi:DNA repair protein RadC